MMPLTYVKIGEQNIIKKIGGRDGMKQHLERLGFVAGAMVTVVSEFSGNYIVNIKESRVAISKEVASKIMV